MLTKVEVYTAQNEMLAFPLQDISGGYLVKDVDGLDPVKATIVSSPFAKRDGTQYQNSRRDNRNIVIKLGIEADYITNSVPELRSQLYRFFMPKRRVSLRFYLDGIYFADISGRVESCQSPMFSREPEVDISILCFDPDFTAAGAVLVAGNTVSDSTEMPISYPGTVEVGGVFVLSVNRAISEFTINNQGPGAEYQTLEFAHPLSAGDVLTISTVSGAKRATLTRAGSDSSVLYGVSPSSSWINLYPGINQFRVLAEGAPIPYTFEFLAKYGGL